MFISTNRPKTKRILTVHSVDWLTIFGSQLNWCIDLNVYQNRLLCIKVGTFLRTFEKDEDVFWYFLKSLTDDSIEKIHSVIILNVKFILSNWKNSKPKRSYWKCFLFWITLLIHRRWSAIVQKFHDKKSECILVIRTIIIMIWVKTLLSLNLHQPSLTL